MGDAVFTSLDDEAVQVLVSPAQGELEGGMQVGNGGVAANQQAAPDQRADAAEHDPQLDDHRC
jgi:hypothetical protein